MVDIDEERLVLLVQKARPRLLGSCFPPGTAVCEPFGRQTTAAQSDIRKFAIAEALQVCKNGVNFPRVGGHLVTNPVATHNASNLFNHPYRPQGHR